MPIDRLAGIPPPPDERGISGIGVRRAQGGQPRGIGEALGYGLLNASDMASEALPGFIQSAGQAQSAGQSFAGGLGLGLLSSLGGPARQAVQQDEKRRAVLGKLQSSVIEHGMKYMDQDSLNKLFAEVGLDAEAEPRAKQSALYNQSIRALWQAMLRKGQTPQNIQEIGDALAQDPAIAPLLEGLNIEATPSGALEWFYRSKGIYTDDSFDDFINPSSPNHLNPNVLKPKPAGAKGGNSFAERYFNDTQAALKEIAIKNGFVDAEGNPNLDAARPFYFENNTDAESLYDKVLGKSSATPQSLREKALRLARQTNPFFSLGPPDQQERELQAIEKQLAGSTPQASPRAAGYKPPKPDEVLSLENMAGKTPAAEANRKAAIMGLVLTEYGLLPPGAQPTFATITGILNSQNPDDKEELKKVAAQIAQHYKATKKFMAQSPQAMEYLQRLGLPFVPANPLPGMVPPGMEGEDQTMIEPDPGEEIGPEE